jgi:hypothetical protein
MRRRLLLLTLGSALVLAACSDTGGAGDATATLPTSGTTALDTENDSGQTGTGEALAEFQTEVDQLSDAIAESEAAQDLSTAWTTLSAELAAGIATMQEDGTVAREEIESGIEEFEQRLDELNVEENVRTAWESLRTQIEQLMITS